jgi:hypothetical protein
MHQKPESEKNIGLIDQYIVGTMWTILFNF